ncbi:MAG: hypothetical protein AAFN10_07225 [Bacteroidota bacterium]
MSSDYQPFESLPPRKLLLHHRLILLCSGTMSQISWSLLAMGNFFTLIFGTLAVVGAEEGPGVLPIIIASTFTITGIYFLFGVLKRNFKTVDLLTNGKFARGKLVNQEKTNTIINDKPVIKYTVRFQADNGRKYEVSSKTHLSDRIDDESEERVLYLSADPSWGEIFDSISERPEFLADGRIQPPHWSKLFNLLIPSLGLISFFALILSAFAGIRILLTL